MHSMRFQELISLRFESIGCVKWNIEVSYYLLQSTKLAPSQILRYRTTTVAIFPFMVFQVSSESMQKMDVRLTCAGKHVDVELKKR